MAEFKLGRIRFVWQGDWAANTVYVADDVVSFGGKSYICIRNHTASAEFNTDFSSDIPKWDIVSDGTSWRGQWQPEVEYAPGDVVKYGALVYICEIGHTSATFADPDYLGLEANLADWTPFATSFDWKGDWTTATRYKINDLVKFGGYTYLCNTAHVSAATEALGLEADQGKWTLFSDGLVYLGEWQTAVRYKVNDVVKFGGNVFICTAPHTSNAFLTDEAYWDVFIEGFQFEDSWNNSTVYQIGDTVTYGGYVYVAKQNNQNSQPTSNPLDWDVFTTGFKFQGDWVDTTAYRVGDVVRLGGSTYVALSDNTDQEPPNATFWSLLNSGINWTDSVETFSQVLGTNVAGSGSGARFDVIKSKTVYTVSVSTGFAGTGYADNDVITLSGADVGGTTPANDITITVTGSTGGAIDTITHVGYSSTWKEAVDYRVGDVVIFGASSFICVQKHTSTAGDRPDLDLTATYWNLLTLGSEAFALTTQGDMVYYGENGPTRLPIGVDGQILRATDGVPDWANYGLIDNVVYVGPLGTDEAAPIAGLTIDKPWRSVRYALDQVREGYLNPNAKQILKANKQFVMKEVTNWIAYTYNVTVTATTSANRQFTCNSTANLTAGMPIEFDGTLGGVTVGQTYYVEAVVDATNFRITETFGGISYIPTDSTGSMQGNLSYDAVKCERDTGLFVDALIYDISRGGTLKTVTATKAYYNRAGNEYITADLATQKNQNVAAFTYMKELVLDLLANKKPLDYQSLNGIAIEDRAAQNIDFSLIAEQTAVSKAADLMNIVTVGIASESATAIPSAINPNTTVFIKTGTYDEILPIIVPEYTAIVGDELRTSVVQPAPAIASLETDVNKTTSALNRIKDIIPDLMQNIAVTPTSGNTAAQQYINGYGGTTTSTNRLNTGIEIISDVLAEGIDVANAYSAALPVPTSGTNNASDAGFANAIAQLQANKAFIQAEITAWIQAQIDGAIAPFTGAFTYDAVACARDVGYLIDSTIYDLTYGGNLETIVSARAYFVDGSPVYGVGEKEETLAAYARLKAVIGEVILETAVTPSAGNVETQDTTGTPGSAGAQTFAEARIQDVYDTIDTDGTLPTEILPDLSWVETPLTTVNTEILAVKSAIQAGAVAWVQENYPNLTFDTAKCSRDVGYIIDALRYDIMFGSDFRSLKAGMAYRRGIASTEVVIASQLEPTLGTVDYIREEIKNITTGSAKIQASADLMTDILVNGSGSIPTSFVIPDPTGYDTGFFNARRLVRLNKQFLVDEVEAYMVDNYNALWVSLDSDQKAEWLTDVEYMIDALDYDLTYRGNLETIVTARSYYTLGTFVRPADQKAATLAVQTRLADIIDDIATGVAITKSVSNLNTQDTTGTAGSAGAAAFAVDRFNEIYSTIDTGLEPAIINPSLAWVDSALVDLKSVIDARRSIIQEAAIDYINFVYPELVYDEALCSRDVGYIIDAIAYDTIFGSDFRSVRAATAYRRGTASAQQVLGSQLQETLSTISFINESLLELSKGVTSKVGTRAAADRAASLAEDIKTIVANGLNALPPIELPAPTNHNTASLVDVAYATASNTTGSTLTYGDAAAQIVANHAFIQDEIRHWLEDAGNGYDVVWGSISPDGQDRCIRDVGYILDAIRYDLTYGGNTQSLIAGSAYYSNFVLTISAEELPATLAAYARLSVVIGEVIAETPVTTSPGVTEVQDTAGTPGNAASIEFAQDRVQDILDYINNGEPNATIEVATDWAGTEVKESYARLVNRRTEIVEDTVYWVEKFWQSISYNQETCRRDSGLMADAIARDVVTGSNFASVKAGMSYYRAIASTAIVRNSQLDATVGAVNFMKEKVRRVAAVSASAASEIIIDDVTAYIDGGALPTNRWVAPSDADEQYVAAASIIWENKAFIQEEVIAFIAANYPEVVYSEEKCRQDVGYIVDALRYDLTYNSNSASIQAASAYYLATQLVIDENDKTATLAAYDHVKFLVGDLAINTIGSPGAVQTEVTPVFRDELQTIGSVAASVEAESLMSLIYNIIDQGPDAALPTVSITDITTNVITTEFAHGLGIGNEIIVQSGFNGLETGKYYVKTVDSATEFTVSPFFGGATQGLEDGTGLGQTVQVIRTASVSATTAAIRQQFTNVQGSKSAIQTAVTEFIVNNYPTLTYDTAKCERDVGLIIDAVGRDMMSESNYNTIVAALSYYRGAQADLVLGEQKTATVQAYRELKNLIASYQTSSVTIKRTNALMDIIIKILDKGAKVTPEINGTISYFNDRETINAVDILKINKNFLANEATAWVTQNYSSTVSSLSDVPTIVEFTSEHNYIVGDQIAFDADVADLTAGTTYYVSEVVANNQVRLSATRGGESITVVGVLVGNPVATYVYDEALCRRDMERYIDAIAYDLQYPGNHKAWKAAELYLNAVQGSQYSDMFHVRNSTGVRNMTLSGMRGQLTELNENGTRRPTGGSAVSLDPGFGPTDSESWVTNKSCYVQNVTNFGSGCVGCKIDGAIHAGGNRSIVSNDFTQILSDGIGVWCSGNDSLTELVSVFCYYTYAGYLADFGGRIRATNGNSSYGQYGVIAEGTDTGEVPIFAEVDNLSAEAQISEVITDGTDKVLRIEYGNAGRNYTNAEVAISGSGFNATVIDDEFRDGAVFETRLIDLDDGNDVGGSDYITAKNVAQGGDEVSITLAATDTALANAYNGMNIILTSGTGAGQYGTALRFNNGTKAATVYKPSFTNLTVVSTSATGNIVQLDAGNNTDQLYVNMPVYFNAAIGGLNEGTSPSNVYYVTSIPSATTFTVSATEGGADVTLTNDTGTVIMYAAGWDHAIPGTPAEAALDLTTGYTVEPAVTFSSPGYVSTASTSDAAVAYNAATYADGKYVALADNGTATSYSTDGQTWAAGGALPASVNWADVVFGGGTGATATAVVGGLGGSGAVLEAELGELNSIGLPGPTQIKRINVIDGGNGYTTAPTITITPTAGGGGAKAVATVLNGSIQEVIIVSTGAGYGAAPTITADTDKVTEIIVNSAGNGYLTPPTVTITGGGASTPASVTATLNNQGVATITIDEDSETGDLLNGAGYTTQPTVEIVDPTAKFVAIASGTNNNANLVASAADTDAWAAGTGLPATDFASIAYGNGVYVVVGGTSSAASSTDGSTWVNRTIATLAAGTYSSVAYGGNYFVAINSGGDDTQVSTNGITWAAGGILPAAAVWSDIAYGNGRFVAIANGSRSVAYSYDFGTTWYSSPAGLPSAAAWDKIVYGQGLFVATSSTGNTIATSPDGVTWTAQTLPAGAAGALAFGNPSSKPTWVTLSSAANTNASYIKTGATPLGRATEADGAITEIKMVEPGSGFELGNVVSLTAPNTIDFGVSRLEDNQAVVFSGLDDYGLETGRVYYIIGSTISGTTAEVSLIKGTSTPVAVESIASVGTFSIGPVVTITDPNSTVDAVVNPRIGNGALANPTFTNRGTGYQAANAELSGDGHADLFQPSTFIAVRGLFTLPQPGSNVEFAGIDNRWYKLVTISNVIGQEGNYTATFQISPGLTVLNAPADGTLVTTTNKYSQVRLTGHDFLYIGTGNQAQTNYPFVDITTASIDRQQLSSGGGRVFFTSTDQDGNFNVGGLFGVQQSTGTATLDADAFNLAGLQSLQLNGLGLGIGSAIITQFSTDPFFTENSDNIVPTQRAIRSYITAQIGGGQSSLNVNTLTAGTVFIANDEITTTSGGQLNIKAKMNFTGGIDGAPVALGFFLAR